MKAAVGNKLKAFGNLKLPDGRIIPEGTLGTVIKLTSDNALIEMEGFGVISVTSFQLVAAFLPA